MLHDDFYEDDGTATQAESEVENAHAFSAPTMPAVRHDPEQLLDFSITRWQLKPEVIAAWNTLHPRTTLSTLWRRFENTRNVLIRARILSICAATVRELGADFVRRAWDDFPENVPLVSLAEASAACLPHGEGVARVTASLARLDGREKRDQMFGLSYFRSPDSLAWIEQNVFEPITESWGYLAAASRIDWSRVESWLSGGRPLSLVAIDALSAITDPKTPFLREHIVTLATLPDEFRLREVLLAYRARDAVPRVQHRIDAVLARSERLTAMRSDAQTATVADRTFE